MSRESVAVEHNPTTLLQGQPEEAVGCGARASAPQPRVPCSAQLSPAVSRMIASIERAINAQLDAILHHPRFQQLEAAWRGVELLLAQTEPAASDIVVRLLNVSWRELARDAERAVEFDHTQLFQKVYEQEFGHPGGIPFSVLIGAYEVHLRPVVGQTINDLDVLHSIQSTAAAAFAPFIAAVHPSSLGLDTFATLERGISFEHRFDGPEYAQWRKLRTEEDARFLGLTLPRILMRLPYPEAAVAFRISRCRECQAIVDSSGACPACGAHIDLAESATVAHERLGFRFAEDVSAPDRSGYLWGNAAFAFATVLIRAFKDCGWLADIRGFVRDTQSGGVVTGLPVQDFGLDSPGVATKFSTDVKLDERFDREVADLGFIPLCHCHDTPFCVFYSNRSVHSPPRYSEPAADLNAQIAAMLQYLLCASRFAHYLKVLARDKMGSVAEAAELQSYLSEWVTKYVTRDSNASPQMKARFPLREAEVQVRADPARPGAYQCILRLWPHYQLDELAFSVQLRTKVYQEGGGAPSL